MVLAKLAIAGDIGMAIQQCWLLISGKKQALRHFVLYYHQILTRATISHTTIIGAPLSHDGRIANNEL